MMSAEVMMSAEGDAMMSAEGAGDAMISAEGEHEVVSEQRCRFRDCLCCWEYFSLTPRVAPGIDHVSIPDAADRLPAWSLLVGVTDGASSLRVSRLRVARSGRILGRSDDALDFLHNIGLDKRPGYSFEAGAAPLAPDGRSLCVLHYDAGEQPQALQLNLHPQAYTKELPLPEIEGTGPCIPISADGHIWALSTTLLAGDDIDSFSVVARRLVPKPGGGQWWEQVGAPFTSSLTHYRFPPWCGFFLQGYAVLPDAKLILVSFQQYGLFLTFSIDSGSWTRVLTDTDETRSQKYLPIFGRGIYVEQQQAVYMLRENTIYTYKLIYQRDDQGRQQLKLDLPVKIDLVCPFIPEKGYGFLTRLDDCLMCSVWISLAWRNPCPCNYLHAIVTTFHLRDAAHGGIKVLHSTYRRVDMVPNPPADQKFCFLQEYDDQGSPVLQQLEEEQENLTSSQHEPSKMLGCCRNMVDKRSITPRPMCFECGNKGHVTRMCSLQPKEPSSTIPISIPVCPSSRQPEVSSSSPAVFMKPATATIKKDLFIICQAGSRSLIYQTGAMDDDGEPLKRCYFEDEGDHYWHFFQSGSKIHAVSAKGGSMLELSLNKDLTIIERAVRVRRPAVDPFVLVIRVGGETIALTGTLQVFHQTRFSYDGSTTWLRYTADESNVVSRRVRLSGYVAVSDDSFIVCDAVTCSCLLFDLGAKQWRVVMPLATFKEDWWSTAIRTNGLLNGRCVFVDGFIYTCRNGGLAAYELLSEDTSLYLSRPVVLPFSWDVHCLGKDMCFDYAGKDVDSGANLFYVLQQDGYSPPKHGVRITSVKVMTKRTASNKMKPTGIDRVDGVTRFIHHTKAIDKRCCFAVSCL